MFDLILQIDSKEVHVWKYFALVFCYCIELAISVPEIYYIEIGINDDQNKQHYKDNFWAE